MSHGFPHLHPRLIFFFVCLLQVGIQGESIAGLNEAYEAWKQGDYKTAYREYSILAEQGDAKAQYALGHLYNRGEGVTKDPAKALVLFKKAAEQGLPRAQIHLGDMYSHRKDAERNDCLAVEWYQKAVNQGSPVAQYELAWLYMSGRCLPQDDNKALMLMELAAKQGYGDAQIKLAKMYRSGDHVSQDFEKAQHWYRIAGDEGALILMCRERLGNMEDCSRDDIWRGIIDDVEWWVFITLSFITFFVPLLALLLLPIDELRRGKILTQTIIFVVAVSGLLVSSSAPLFLIPYAALLVLLYGFYKGHPPARVILGLLFILAVPAWLSMAIMAGATIGNEDNLAAIFMLNVISHFFIALILFLSSSIAAFQSTQRSKYLGKQ